MIRGGELRRENATRNYFQNSISHSDVPLQASPFRSKKNLYHQESCKELEPLRIQESPDKIQQDVISAVSSIKSQSADSLRLRLNSWTDSSGYKDPHFSHGRFERNRGGLMSGNQFIIYFLTILYKDLGVNNVLKLIQSFIINSIVKRAKSIDICQIFHDL